MRSVVLSVMAALLVCTAAGAAPAPAGPARSAPPSWVRPEPWTESTAPTTATGYVDRLLDYQVNLDTEELYCHYAYLITTSAALSDGASVVMTCDPSYQSVTLHAAKRWRSGNVLSQEDAEFRKVQREQSLEEAMYRGEESWVAFLKDVQIGDTIEIAYTIRGFNPVFGGRYCDIFSLQGATPAQRANLRVVYGPGRSPAFKVSNSAVKGTMKTTGATREYTIAVSDLPGIEYEDNLPMGFQPGVRVDVSEFATWADVAAWGTGLYAAAPDDRISAKVRELTAALPAGEARALAVLRWVQDDVRYLGIETGINSHKPRSPAEVLANRFGDCKDKVALLVSMLNAAGVRAWPVLVHTWRQNLVRDDIPSPLSFNHVIAALEWNGGMVYVDPTRSRQGGALTQSALDDFGWGLPLRPGTDGLADMPGSPAYAVTKSEVFHIMDLSGPAELAVKYLYAGVSADYFRARLADRGIDGVRKDLTEAMRDSYGELSETGDPVVEDDRDADTIEVTMHYWVAKLLTKTDDDRVQFSLSPSLILGQLRDPDVVSRRAQPMYFEHPVTIRQVQVVELPAAWPLDPASEKVDDPSFLVTSSVGSSGKTVRIESVFNSRGDRVDPANWEQFLDDLRRSRESVGWTVWHSLSDTTGPKEESPAETTTAQPTPQPDTTAAGVGAVIASILIFLLTAAGMGSDF
jgi:transglutaminase-like putative cysteine protease